MQTKRSFSLVSMLLLALLLGACGSSNGGSAADGSASPTAAASEQAQSTSPPASQSGEASPSDAGTKQVTDAQGREVTVPVEPQRIVYVGSDPGDLLAIGVKPVGASLSVIGTQVDYGDLLEGITDIGYPPNLEKITALDPDLILYNDWDDQGVAPLAKIAATVAIGQNGGFERMGEIAGVLGKKEAADAYIASYDDKVKQVKDRLAQEGKQGQSATVLLLMGKTMYVMGHQGLSVTLYDALGYVPPEKVKAMIAKDERFAEISAEVLPDYIGDQLYLLQDGGAETKKQAEELLAGSLWKTLPAVKNGQVHTLDSRWNFDDPVTRTRLLDEL